MLIRSRFQVSLAIRIRPFFENLAAEIRQAAILLFGDLFCANPIAPTNDHSLGFFNGDTRHDTTVSHISDALREQLFANFMSMLLHLCETDAQIVRVS